MINKANIIQSIILHEAIPFKKIEQNLGYFNGLEVDLQASKDGVVYVFHDKEIDGKIFTNCNSAQIDQIIASRIESNFLNSKGVRDFIIKFEDWLEYVAKNFSYKNILLYFEIKGAGADTQIILNEVSNFYLKFKDDLRNSKIYFASFHEKQIIACENLKKVIKGFNYETMLIFDYGKKDNSEYEADATNCKKIPTSDEIKNLVGNHNLFSVSLDSRYLDEKENYERVLQLIKDGFLINIWSLVDGRDVFRGWQKLSKEQNYDFTYTINNPQDCSIIAY